GLYDDGLVRTHRSIDPSQHKIGKAAQANALRALQDQVDELSTSLDQATMEVQVADSAFMALKALCETVATDLRAHATAYAAAQTDKAEADAKLAALDGAGDGGLRAKRAAQQQLKVQRVAEQKTQQDAFNKHDGEVRTARNRLADGENVP